MEGLAKEAVHSKHGPILVDCGFELCCFIDWTMDISTIGSFAVDGVCQTNCDAPLSFENLEVEFNGCVLYDADLDTEWLVMDFSLPDPKNIRK